MNIANGGPSLEAIESNAHGLAAYAKIAQVGSDWWETVLFLDSPAVTFVLTVDAWEVLQNTAAAH